VGSEPLGATPFIDDRIPQNKPHVNPDLSLSKADNTDKQLAAEQQEYIKDFKVRGDSGDLMVMYREN